MRRKLIPGDGGYANMLLKTSAGKIKIWQHVPNAAAAAINPATFLAISYISSVNTNASYIIIIVTRYQLVPTNWQVSRLLLLPLLLLLIHPSSSGGSTKKKLSI